MRVVLGVKVQGQREGAHAGGGEEGARASPTTFTLRHVCSLSGLTPLSKLSTCEDSGKLTEGRGEKSVLGRTMQSRAMPPWSRAHCVEV